MQSRIEFGLDYGLDKNVRPAFFHYDEHGKLVKIVNSRTQEIIWEDAEGGIGSRHSSL